MINPMIELLQSMPPDKLLEYRDTLVEFALACALEEACKIVCETKTGSDAKSLMVCLTLRPMLESLLTTRRTDQSWILAARCEEYMERFFKEGKL